MHTTYTFKKNGKAYSAKANNRFEAQDQIELAFGIKELGNNDFQGVFVRLEEVTDHNAFDVFGDKLEDVDILIERKASGGQ